MSNRNRNVSVTKPEASRERSHCSQQRMARTERGIVFNASVNYIEYSAEIAADCYAWFVTTKFIALLNKITNSSLTNFARNCYTLTTRAHKFKS